MLFFKLNHICGNGCLNVDNYPQNNTLRIDYCDICQCLIPLKVGFGFGNGNCFSGIITAG